MDPRSSCTCTCTCPRITLSIVSLVAAQVGTTYLAASSSCHAAVFVDCSVLGHEIKSLLLCLLLSKLLPVFALDELVVILIHHLGITALLLQLSPILCQVCMVVINSVDCVTDLDDDSEDHEETSDSKAEDDTDDIRPLKFTVRTEAFIRHAEIISIALS